MDYLTLSRQIRFDNASKGFDPTEGGLDRYLLLTVSEICEAQDELRDGRDVRAIYYEDVATTAMPKPCGFPVEVADAIIRILDIFGKFNEEPRPPVGALPIIKDGEIESILLKAVKLVSQCQGSHFAPGIMQNYVWHNLNMALGMLFTLSISVGIDIDRVIDEKLMFNKSRPPKHGRKF